MKRSTKAALLSCFVLPGVGHWYLKRFGPGLLLSVCALTAVYFIAASAVQSALAVAEQIQDSGVPLDINTIAELAAEQSRASGAANFPTIVLLGCWLIGIYDSYRIGRALERNHAAGNLTP